MIPKFLEGCASASVGDGKFIFPVIRLGNFPFRFDNRVSLQLLLIFEIIVSPAKFKFPQSRFMNLIC